jgi:hypothetical protein
MSNHQAYQEQIYNNYLSSLSIYSTCIHSIVNSFVERNDSFYKVSDTVNLEQYCVYERNQVSKYRDMLNQDNAN